VNVTDPATVVLPDLVIWLQALGPIVTGMASVAIASLVAWIAWGQSRTAQDKLALDLFERRASVLAKVQQATHLIMGPGYPVDREPFLLLHQARAEAQFLFDHEVGSHIGQLIVAIMKLGLSHTMIADKDRSQDWHTMNGDNLLIVEAGVRTMTELMAPYMQFTHKVRGVGQKRPNAA
jgi:hypothetical protein